MEKFISCYERAATVVSWFVLALSALMVGAIVVSIFAEALSRYLLDSSRAFMEEFPRLAIPFIVFPMMGVLLKAGKHISVDILPLKLKGPQRSWLLILVYAVVMAIAVQFFLSGISAVSFFKMMGQTTETEYAVPLWCVYSAFPIGFGLLIFFDLELLLKEIWIFHKQGSKETRSPGDGP